MLAVTCNDTQWYIWKNILHKTKFIWNYYYMWHSLKISASPASQMCHR